MTDKINSLNSNYINQVYTSLKAPKNNIPFRANAKENDAQITELSNAMNESGIKVPLSYVKLDEKDLPYGLKAHFYKLSNGQKVVILPKEGPTVLKSYVNTGSLNEPDNIRGISHYIEHNLFNGSEGLGEGEFFATAEKMGAETNASTGLAETNYFISSNLLDDSDFENQIKIHASMLETPKFAVDMLEKEKGIVNSEINIATASPENIAYQNTLKLLFNIKSSSDDVIAGTTNNITNLTREDVVNYFNNNYYPANMVTVISGEVNPEDAMKLVSKYFRSNKMPRNDRHFEDLKPLEKTVRRDIISDKTQSPHLVMGFKGPKNNNIRDMIYINALSELMFNSSEAEKIFKDINANVGLTHEKVLAKPDANNAVMIFGQSSEENSEAMLRKIYGRIQKFQQQPVSDENLNIVKRDLKKSFVKMMESSFMINSYIGWAMLDGWMNSINDYEKIIDEITPQDLQNVANKYFDLNKTAITMLHPAQSKETSIGENYQKSQNVSFTGAAKKKAYNLDNIKQYKLPNNYNVVTYNSNLPDIETNFSISTDNTVNPSNPAVFPVLNEILENGTLFKTTEELSKLKEKNGAELVILASNRGLMGHYNCDVKDFDYVQVLFNELINNPRFTPETFDKAVRDIKDVISRSEKNPLNKLKPELDKDSHTKEEVLEGLKTLTLDEVKQAYYDILSNNQAIASTVAPFNSNSELKNKVLASISCLKPVKPYQARLKNNFEPISETKVLTDVDNKNQADIVMAYKFKTAGNIKDNASLELMNIIFGAGPTSRLFNDLREKQKLAYRVRSRVNNNQTTGTIMLSIGTTTDNKSTGEQSFDNLQKSINGFKDNIQKITTEKVTEEELAKAKLSMKNMILSDNEEDSCKGLNVLQSAESFYGIDYENKLLEIIDSITVDDIYNTANYVFSGKPIYSIVATQDTLDFNKDYLNNLVK